MPVTDPKEHIKALQMLALATLFWGVSFPVMKALGAAQHALLPDLSSWFSAALTVTVRFGLAALIMLVWSWKTIRGVTRLEFQQGLGLGVFGSMGMLFQMDGLAYTEASTSAFLTQAYCFVIPIIVAFRDRRRPTTRIVVCCALMVAGMVILAQFDPRTMRLGRGEIETVTGSMLFIGQILWLERPVFRGNNVNNFTVVMFAVTSFAALPFALGSMRRVSDLWMAYSSAGPVVLTAVLILLCTMVSYVMMNYWQPKVPATEAGLIYGAEPVCASIFALVLPEWISRITHLPYPNEKVTEHLLAGGGLILAANLLLQYWAAKSKT